MHPAPKLQLAANTISNGKKMMVWQKNRLTATIESTLFSSLVMTVWANFCTLVCKAEDLKKDPKPGNGSGGLLGKSVTFVGLPPSTSPDSSPVSTLSIVSSQFQHFRQF